MNTTLFFGLLAFSLVSAFTPGPNNLLALAQGANFGYRKTLPHVFGVGFGFAFMLFLMGAGLGKLFEAFPAAYEILHWGALAYLVFLAWKIANSKGFHTAGSGNGAEAGRAEGSEKAAADSKPITFFGSAAFQWINPKAWVAAITLVTTFTDPASYWLSLVVAGAANVAIAISAVSSWALFGTIVKKWLSDSRRLKIFNWSMAIILLVSVVPSVFKGR